MKTAGAIHNLAGALELKQSPPAALAGSLTELLDGERETFAGVLLQAVETRRLAVEAEDAPSLARKWLHELLCWFSAERFLPARYRAQITNVLILFPPPRSSS